MTPLVSSITTGISVGVLIANILTLVALIGGGVALFNARFRVAFFGNSVVSFIAKYSVFTMFIVSIVTFFGSNFYSTIAGYVPCILCVWQRFFMFPQFFMLTLASIRRDSGVIKYIVLLSVIGGVIAVWHYYGQVLVPSALPCDAITTAAACAYIPFLVFGFITIPYMSLSAFMAQIAIGVLYYAYRKHIVTATA
ncbi:MAG TPA: disulfide bond formation protein B [Candidatus Paceibacterota bacterium]|nr:disulfide bond formation protein B [Candidatus Paceibacterota bacterium]